MTAVLDTQPAGAAPRARRFRRARAGAPLGGWSGTTLGVSVIWMSLLVLLPLAAVVDRSFDYGWHGFISAVTDREAASALKLTIGISALVAVINAVMGVLIGWVLVRERFRGAGLLEMVIDIPFALPTVVAGIVMLTLYGGDSPVGVHLLGTRTGLVVTLLFVTLPFTVRTVQPVLLQLDRDAEQAAASLGARPSVVFRRIIVPQIMPAVVSGATLAFARALGEYGSLVFISSNLPFKTEIASSFIFRKIQDNDSPLHATQEAGAIATVLLLASAVVLIVLDQLQRRVARRG